MSTKHFSDGELMCSCGCKGLPPKEFQDALERLRVSFGKPMRLSSAFRCPEYNAQVSSTGENGPHTRGAVDVLAWGAEARSLVGAAIAMGWSGIGIAQSGPRRSRFVHLDTQAGPTRPWIWSY